MSKLRFDGRVAVVTGSARGLGREYALLLASRGAAVVVNDLGGDRSGGGRSNAADEVVKQIINSGGKAVADYNSVEDGHLIVKTAIDNFGRIDIVINNAGILRDKSILKITEEDWDLVHRIHLRGSFIVTKAAWPYFRRQNYGRVVMTASPSGIYGNFGQSNYSSAKLGLLALSNTLSIEGSKYNINCNTIVPVAASRLTEDIFPPNLSDTFKPEFVAPVVAWLCHDSCADTGGVFEAAGGFVGKYRWQRSLGKSFLPPEDFTPEIVRDYWHQISDMTNATSPSSMHSHLTQLMNSLTGVEELSDDVSANKQTNQVHSYTIDDVILYAIAVGVSTRDDNHLDYLYECSDQFKVLPTYCTIPVLKSLLESPVLNQSLQERNVTINPTKLVHGEHYLEIYKPIPSSGSFVSKPRIIDVLDKGSGALVIADVNSYDETGELLFYNQLSIFLIDSGNFGGERKTRNDSVKEIIEPPKRTPDAVVYEQTSINQAALYRLCGDKNPLHIDPMFAVIGGFPGPILHGLCSLGFAVRHVLRQYADSDVSRFKCVKTRFTGPILPGQTIQTNMWKNGNRIHFQCFIKETGNLIISGAYVDLLDDSALKGNFDFTINNSHSNEDLNSRFIMRPLIDTSYGFVANNASQSNSYEMLCAPSDLGGGDGSRNDNVCRTDKIFGTWLLQRIRENKELVPIIKTVYQWNIMKNGKLLSVWILDLKNNEGDVYKGNPKLGKADCTLTIDDDYAVDVFEGREDAMKAFMTGRLKITGNILAAQKLQQLWVEEAPRGSVSIEDELSSSDTPSVASIDNFNDSDDSALLESIPISGLKCDIVFTVFRIRMHEEPDLIRKLRVTFQFIITKDGKPMATWTADNRPPAEGDVYRSAPKNSKPDCIVTVEDDDFLKLMVGKLNPQRAFMMGKLKIKGNIMLLQKLNSLWLDLQKQGKAPELPFLTDMMLNESVIPGLRSEPMIVELVQRLIRLPQLCNEIPTIILFNILKDGKIASQWTLDFTKNKISGIFIRGAPKSAPKVTLNINDDDFVRLTYHRISIQDAIASGKVKVDGDSSIPPKLSVLFTTPTSRAKL